MAKRESSAGDKPAAQQPSPQAVPAARLPGAPDRYAAVVTLAQREAGPAKTSGRFLRQRLIHADFKYPLLRLEEEYELVNGGPRVVNQVASVADHVVVKPLPGITEEVLLNSLKRLGASLRKRMSASGLWLVSFPDAGLDTVPQAIAEIARIGSLARYAEPDYIASASTVPNDTNFAQLWGMNNTGQSGGIVDADIDAPEAWDLNTGSLSVVVAVIDSGVDYTHPDLTANIWSNPGEIAGNGLDDDGNGYVDDVRGWNFVNDTNNPMDDNLHGTHVSGTIGAAGNNGTGVAGVCWRVAIMPLKILDATGNGATSDAVEAITYATAKGVTLTSNSWGDGRAYSQSLKDAIDAANTAGILFIAAAGNSSSNNDTSADYPASYTCPNIIAVAATTRQDLLAYFSNYGATKVHLGAPGSDIYSTTPGNSYALKDGTSMATPHVAGACALVKACRPSLTHMEIRDIILASTDPIPALAGKTITGGRLNVYSAMLIACGITIQPSANLSSSGMTGGPFAPMWGNYTITNHTASPVNWAVTGEPAWLSLSQDSGTLAGGASVDITITINAAANELASGSYVNTLTFHNASFGVDQTRTFTLSVHEPFPQEVSLTGNGGSIPDGNTSPALANHTDFGSAVVNSGAVVRTFTIQNSGNLPLNLTGTPIVVVHGAHAADFTVTEQPASPVAAGGSTTFQVTFAPSAAWLRTAALSIANDDPDKNPYDFAIQGTGTGTLTANYVTASDVPLPTGAFTATGSTVDFTLNFAPATGTDLMVVRNAGLGFINGTFNNLAQGQRVALAFGGISYDFVANYYGGSGNDLVLVWAYNRIFAWGYNSSGQIGDNTTIQRLIPVPVTVSGMLADKTAVTISAGTKHSLALFADGTVAAWGSNIYGQLGDNTTTQRTVPVAVNTAAGVSALSGKTVVAIAAGNSHSLALCSDGTVAAWGFNSYGQLGDNATVSANSSVPVLVQQTGALAGKAVVSLAAGSTHSLALCSDGTVAAWGYNYYGQLGDNTTTQSKVPVAVNMVSEGSALFGKTVVSIAACAFHSMALCSDGTVAAWGDNTYGWLGDNTTTQRNLPVAVNTTSGVSALFGKTVVALATGQQHSIALCSDATVATWGYNSLGQLGDNTMTQRPVPVAVNTDPEVSALSGKSVAAIAAGSFHSLALGSDGTVTAWGKNNFAQLGDNTTTQRNVPVAVNTTLLAAGECLTRVTSGSGAYHTLALVAGPAPEIRITGGSGSIPDGGCQDFGNVAVGSDISLAFTITNRGAADLTGLGITINGADSAMFAVTADPVAPVSGAGGTTSFTVRFAPTTAGMKTAAMHIASNDPDENPFAIALIGNAISPLQIWRMTHFGMIDNSGDGADLNDFDHDGLPNLIEYAFGLDPRTNGAGLLPQPLMSENNFVVTFTEPAGVSGITYGAEWSQTLLPGSWTAAADTGTPPQHTFTVPIATNPRFYMRLKVTSP